MVSLRRASFQYKGVFHRVHWRPATPAGFSIDLAGQQLGFLLPILFVESSDS